MSETERQKGAVKSAANKEQRYFGFGSLALTDYKTSHKLKTENVAMTIEFPAHKFDTIPASVVPPW